MLRRSALKNKFTLPGLPPPLTVPWVCYRHYCAHLTTLVKFFGFLSCKLVFKILIVRPIYLQIIFEVGPSLFKQSIYCIFFTMNYYYLT